MRVSRKKFVKRLMSAGVSWNVANETADLTVASNRSYRDALNLWYLFIVRKLLYDRCTLTMHTNAFTPKVAFALPQGGFVMDAPLMPPPAGGDGAGGQNGGVSHG